MAKYKEEEYREAFEKWLSENPGKTVNDVPSEKVVKISNGKEINLGALIVGRRHALKKEKLVGEKYEYWVENYGLRVENQSEKKRNQSELEVREAFEKWLSENSGKTVNDVSVAETILISSGKEINLGSMIKWRRDALKKEELIGEKYEYWVTNHGLSVENKSEKKRYEDDLEVREAFEKWLSENPEKTVNDVLSEELVKNSNGKEINLGRAIIARKQALKNNKLIGEKYEYWVTNHGLSVENRLTKKRNESELELREAFEKWLSENSEKTVNDIAQGEIVKISNGKEINLGDLINNRKEALKKEKLVGEKYEYWVTNHGLSPENKLNKKELELREAFEKWLSENPGKTVNDISQREVVKITNGQEIYLGKLISNRKVSLKNGKLVGEKYEYWVENHGLNVENQLNIKWDEAELELREAFEKWLDENPGKTVNDVPTTEIVLISNGKEINLGTLIGVRKRDFKNNILIGAKYEYWVTNHGLTVDNKLEKKYKESELELREAFEKWLSKNPGKTVNDVPAAESVLISNGKKINLGGLICNRKYDLKNNKLVGEKYEYWVTNHSLSIENQLNRKQNEDELELREAFKKWLNANPGKTVNDVPVAETILISNGKEINLGSRIADKKKILRKKNLVGEKYEYWVTNHGLSGENQLEKKRYEAELEVREAFEKWLSENPRKTVNDVPCTEVVKITNGQEIYLGKLISNRKVSLKKEKLVGEKYSYWVEKYGLKAYKNDAKQEDYLELFNGDKEKAIRVEKCLKDLREKRRVKKKQEWNIDNILKEFDVDLETLEKYLARTRTEEVKPRAKVLEYEGKTLRSFCIENGYNYDVVARAIKLHDMCRYDTLEQLINRSLTTYNKKGQREPATWIYEKYGNLVKHVLLHLKLDFASILRDMTNYIMTLEEAVRHDVFKRNIDNKGNAWLEELYNYLIEEINDNKEQKQTEEDIADMFVILVQEYKLTKEEYQVLWKTFSNYVDTMREYQRVDVGLETNQSKKLEKIKQYNLDEYDIEESFFIPLEFDKGVLLGRQSELYKRRQLLKQYIIDWDYYTDMEKEAIKEQNNFTDEELIYIKNTRDEINETIEETNKHI